MVKWIATRERVSGIVFVALGVTVIAIASTFRYSTHFAASYNPRVFPQIIGVLFMISGLSLVVTRKQNRLSFSDYRSALPFMLLLLLYSFFTELLGWRVSTPIMLASGMIIMGERRARVVLLVSLTTTVLAYLLFYEVLFIDFPVGVFAW